MITKFAKKILPPLLVAISGRMSNTADPSKLADIAIGLVIVLWHILRERPSIVLVLRLTALGLGALYLCVFVNFASIIAKDTITRAGDADSTTSVDWDYLCHLGPTAAKGVLQGLATRPNVILPAIVRSCFQREDDHSNWREIGFRTARTRNVLNNVAAW